MSSMSSGLVIDIRGLTPAFRRPLLFTVIDKMIDVGCTERLMVISDHEPAGLVYQMELRKETRGLFEFSYDQRLDGAWVAIIRRRSV